MDWTPEQELSALHTQAQAMEEELQGIRQRITELEKQQGEEKNG
jgi:predicted  nucleic acid-binding Zn-ribbon protein